jgi:hypothetical protein
MFLHVPVAFGTRCVCGHGGQRLTGHASTRTCSNHKASKPEMLGAFRSKYRCQPKKRKLPDSESFKRPEINVQILTITFGCIVNRY